MFRADKSESISTDNIHVAIEGLTCSMSQYNLCVAVREPPSLQCLKCLQWAHNQCVGLKESSLLNGKV